MWTVLLYRNLSLNQFTGVFDGGMRTSGHVNAYMINNNITAVINLPSPFIDPKYVLHFAFIQFKFMTPGIVYTSLFICVVFWLS